MTMNAAVMNLFLLLLGMIPIGHYAFAPSYYLSSSSSIGSSSSSSSSSNTRLYYNNNNNTDNNHDTVGSDGERYFDGEKEQLQAERERLLSLFASSSSSSSSSSSPSPTPSSPSSSSSSSSSGKDKKEKKKMYFSSKLEKSSSTQEANEQTKKEVTNSSNNNKKTKEEGSSSRPSSPLPKKLSSMARKSLEMEMKLLESLKDSDDAQGELWNFWYNHRGYKKMTYLYGAGQMCQHPNQWSEAELILRELIQQESDEFSSSSSSSLMKKSFKKQNKNDCSSSSSSSSKKTGQVKNESISSKFQSKEKDDTKAKDNGKDCNCDGEDDDDDDAGAYYSGCYGWVEPVNRLATLLFYQGRLKEAKELCEFVLKYKPWHFGCQTGIVTVCQHLNDTEGIEYWSSKRMPPLVNNDATTNNNKPIPPGFSSNVNSNNKENTNNPTPREVWVNNMLQEAQNMLDFNGYDEDGDDDCQNCEEGMEVLLKEEGDEDENQSVWE